MGGILLIDDNPAFLFSLAETLRVLQKDCLVETARSAEEALLYIALIEYDAIISDFRLSGMDGMGLLKASQSRRPSTPVILITGHGDTRMKKAAAHAGAYAFLHKPIDPAELLAVVSRATLHAQRARQAEPEPSMPVSPPDPFVEKSQAILRQLRGSTDQLQKKMRQWMAEREIPIPDKLSPLTTKRNIA
jgi:DNA-binding NtrC family response regulator